MANIFSEALNRLFGTGDFLMEKHEQGKRTLLHKEVGEVVFSKVRRSRNIRIALRPGQPVSVTLPYHVSYAEADKLLLEKISWIKEEQAKFKATADQRRTFTDEEIARLRAQAKQFLPARVEFLANKFGFRFNKITVKDIRSRWGSCSSANNLNFSIYLMNLPDDLVDYVILHELCHTIHRNHGTRFWTLLDECTDGKARQLSARMNTHSMCMF
jgi:predicted metal-dependent hydrolase